MSREVKLTHPEREIWPGDGITKRELYDYFGAIAEVMLPHVRQRPVSMQRFRGSIEDGGFFMKEVPKGAPDWVATVEVPKRTRPPGVVHHVLANDRETLQWLAQQACGAAQHLLATVVGQAALGVGIGAWLGLAMAQHPDLHSLGSWSRTG